MNKRKAKKRKYKDLYQLKVWGWTMTYSEQRRLARDYHEYVVSIQCRNKKYDHEAEEELARILGITYEPQERKYIYPNRERIGALHKQRMKMIKALA